ncbi:DUF3109 family protein [Brevibacillus dissolubilis]|uniref:DUF3109 family protein n=1 Tax=Brevibacillus dissolubilis TaxID=1844116 RepID=UPI00111668B0|nr:DUF3109 family protein [Brevibacillus dissolubilis]
MIDLEEYRYYGTTDPMPKSEAYRCSKYLKRHKDDILLIGQYLIDTTALMTPCNLDCFHCSSVHRETCCEGGQPYSVDGWQIPLLEQEGPQIIERFFTGSAHRYASQHGIWDREKEAGTPATCSGSCLFYREVDGTRLCAIHAHAIRADKDVYSLKPFSCQLYPIELIQLGSYVLITALTEETAPFSRWGYDYLDSFYCSNLKKRQVATHIDPDRFRVEDYQPAYVWGEEVISRAFGPELYDQLRRLLSSEPFEPSEQQDSRSHG